MDSVLRGLAVYVFLLVLFRVAGKRALSEATTFDLVLTLIISESVQQAMIDTDNSMTNAFLLVVTLVGTDIALSLLKQRVRVLERVLEGVPLVMFSRGRFERERMRRERIDEEDLKEAARAQGCANLDEVEYAVLERGGGISIVPRRDHGR